MASLAGPLSPFCPAKETAYHKCSRRAQTVGCARPCTFYKFTRKTNDIRTRSEVFSQLATGGLVATISRVGSQKMKRVLVVHFSQTGQLTRVKQRLLSPLAEASDVELVEEVLRPRKPYPFPWPLLR